VASLEILVPGAIEQPFPGLRSFEAHESFLFFGRAAHTQELLRLLATNRILAVVGTSGSGKSSLVRAGLIPELHRGHLAGAGSRWRIAVMRPGESPLDSLADALGSPDGSPGADMAEIRSTLGESSLGLLKAVRGKQLRPDENFLLLVDQFEELFRYKGQAGGDEAKLFVQSLLEATDQLLVPVFVLITMRSDFLGLCDRFRGLPETLNHSQYLIPRLTRDELRKAILDPLRLADVEIAPDLLQRLLNDVGDDRDQLPVLQHALMRTFMHWKAKGEKKEIRYEDYREAGGLDHALDRHAQGLLEGLPSAAHRSAAQRIFRALTTQEAGRAVRRPQALAHLYAIAGATTPEQKAVLRDVVKAFSARENSLLLVTRKGLDQPQTVVDITHESLMRKWQTLREWVRDEARSVEYYTYASRDAALHRDGNAAPWRPPALDAALKYVSDREWNEAWAAQYLDARAPFAETTAFLRMSKEIEDALVAREEERRRKELETAQTLARSEARAKRWARGVAALLALLLVGTLVSAWVIYSKQQQVRVAEQRRVEAEDKVSTLTKAQDDVNKKLADAERKAAQGGLTEQEKADLTALRQAKANVDKQLGSALTQAKQSSDASTQATRLIADLQAQLSTARTERDTALKERDAAVKGGAGKGAAQTAAPAADAELLRRATAAEARVRELEAQVRQAGGSLPPPAEPPGVKKNLEWSQAYDEGRAALEQGKLPEAVYYLRRALEKAGSDAKDVPYLTRTIPYYVPNYYLALAYLAHGSLDEACRSARAAEASKALQKEDWWRASVAAVRRASCEQRTAAKSD
jgi:Novel STAND NTPase 1